jgi:flagellar FliL protein
MVKLADFVIHLRNPEVDRYARMSFDVEVMNDSDKERLNANVPRVRDAFISYLSDRTLEELRGSEGLGRAKDALQQRLRELVPEARVRALYISDFVVQ